MSLERLSNVLSRADIGKDKIYLNGKKEIQVCKAGGIFRSIKWHILNTLGYYNSNQSDIANKIHSIVISSNDKLSEKSLGYFTGQLDEMCKYTDNSSIVSLREAIRVVEHKNSFSGDLSKVESVIRVGESGGIYRTTDSPFANGIKFSKADDAFFNSFGI